MKIKTKEIDMDIRDSLVGESMPLLSTNGLNNEIAVGIVKDRVHKVGMNLIWNICHCQMGTNYSTVSDDSKSLEKKLYRDIKNLIKDFHRDEFNRDKIRK